MGITIHILLAFVTFISYTHANEDKSNMVNVENLKILRKSVNFAFKMGNEFLDLIRGSTPPDEPIKQMISLIKKGNFRLSDFVMIYSPYIGYIVLITIGLLFAILMPIVGFCFCLCRCGEKCGGKVKGMDPKHATCKRHTYAIMLGMISVIMLGGIVLAFINNQLIHDTLTNPSVEINAMKQISQSSQMMRKSLENISKEISNSKHSQNYDYIDKADFPNTISENFIDFVTKLSLNQDVQSKLDNVLGALFSVLTFLNEVKKPNSKLQEFTTNLQDKKSNLKVSSMRKTVYNMLNNLSSDFEDIKKSMKNQKQPETSTDTKLRELVRAYNETILHNIDIGMKKIDEHVKVEYLEYRMYICIGVGCLLLLIVLFYFLGLCFGQCGERPFEDARICNRGVGANLMMAGVAFAFLFTPLIMFLTIALFTIGGSLQTEHCRYLTNAYQPGVKTYSKLFEAMWKNKEDPNKNEQALLYYKDALDSIINRCPSMSMAEAFNINTDFQYPEVMEKINILADKIYKKSKSEIILSYLGDINDLIGNISSGNGLKYDTYDGFDQNSQKIIKERIDAFTKSIFEYKSISPEEKVISFFNKNAENSFTSSLNNQVKTIFTKVFVGSYDNIRCVGMYNSTKMLIDAACVTFLWPFNGFWYGVGICLVFTIPAIIFAVKLAGLYRHTEKYSTDYEEPDYHSYMGFYTNNADNIPMKKPKSGKANQKNRNSNFSNKDSVKQTNPQYLPVYPYDAYE